MGFERFGDSARDPSRGHLARTTAVALLLGTTGCGVAEEVRPELIDPGSRMRLQGRLELPTTVWEDNPRAFLEAGDLHAYTFGGVEGGVVTIRMREAECGALDPSIDVFGPEGTRGTRALTVSGSDGACPRVAEVEHLTLAADGDYTIIATAASGRGGYRLDVECEAEPCAPDEMTFARSRALADIVPPDSQAASDIGKFLFLHVHRITDGLGNGLDGSPGGGRPRPNLRAQHNGPFGGPDAQSCVSCHNLGGRDGAGGVWANIYQAGDGKDAAAALVRNPPSLHGAGVRQAIAAEISRSLQTQAAALVHAAGDAGAPAELCVEAGPGSRVCFGNASVDAHGAVTGVVGVDADLVVRPFGWKGRERTLRDFARGGFRVHLGMQAEAPIDAYCDAPADDAATARFRVTWGDPFPDCRDPDRDGIEREVTEGQLTAMAVYLLKLPRPARAAPSPDATRGEELFAEIGCAGCHTPSWPLPGGRFVDPQTGLEVSDLAERIEIWSDFKRHDMGQALADTKPFKNDPNPAIAPRWFITAPLWDVARSAPYLHDGRAATLDDAIADHGGAGEEAARASADAYARAAAEEKQQLLAFLATLGSSD